MSVRIGEGGNFREHQLLATGVPFRPPRLPDIDAVWSIQKAGFTPALAQSISTTSPSICYDEVRQRAVVRQVILCAKVPLRTFPNLDGSDRSIVRILRSRLLRSRYSMASSRRPARAHAAISSADRAGLLLSQAASSVIAFDFAPGHRLLINLLPHCHSISFQNKGRDDSPRVDAGVWPSGCALASALRCWCVCGARGRSRSLCG